jgi:2-oxoglutarate dehydrogenase complex dehydrogenase (E1) component-like enzyme
LQKWGERSSVVMLLPHGYEGQGPDHSSARIERFLALCAEKNMTVAQPSSPASYFHLLRWHMKNPARRPLVVFTPKSMLRLKAAASKLEDFTSGTFRPLIDDASALNVSIHSQRRSSRRSSRCIPMRICSGSKMSQRTKVHGLSLRSRHKKPYKVALSVESLVVQPRARRLEITTSMRRSRRLSSWKHSCARSSSLLPLLEEIRARSNRTFLNHVATWKCSHPCCLPRSR